MNKHRLVVNLTEAEKTRIVREAAALGINESGYVRKAVELLDADDIRAIEEFRPLVPEFNAALARIHDTLVAAAERSEKHQQEMDRLRSPEYREEVRRSIEEDLAGLDVATSLFSIAPATGPASEVQPPVPATVDERKNKAGGVSTRVREPRTDWRGEDSEPAKKPSK
jgi:hypothetical protein